MRTGVKKKSGCGETGYFLVFVICVFCLFYLVVENAAVIQPTPCDKSRKVFNTSWGIITDGPAGSNYTQDSHCEWLIKANNSRQFITLTFRAMGTECSYDYVFVYDGDSFRSPLLGSFSGKTVPQQITASSGAMLILLYSDTNYVLDGFQAEFSVANCANNCSSHGMCADHICVCDEGWGGKDCSRELCPERCGSGTCASGSNKCMCEAGYSGQACTLHRGDAVGNRWHWLSHSNSGLSPRAAHTAVYLNDSDSLYVFGGYDLNNVLGDLIIYRFNTSVWEDEHGNILDDGTATKPVNPQQLLAALWEQVGEKRWSVRPKTSFFGNILLAIADNSTQSFRQQTGGDNPGHLLRVGRHTRRGHHLRSKRDDQVSDLMEEHSTTDGLEETELRTGHDPTTTVSDVSGEEDVADSAYEVFRLEESTGMPPEMETDEYDVPSRPAARYGHAACSYPGGFVLYGGKLANGSLSDELWFYNATGRQWSLRARRSIFRPPELTRHTLTRVGKSNWLYLFGGSTLGGEFSSRLFRIRLNLENPWQERWAEVRPRGGKELDLRVVAHSTVYHTRTNSLLVYGGVLASVARFSKLSDRMFSFQLDSKHWSEIHYPRAHLRDTYVPRERAFHTSTIVGNYLVVFGGYSHRHNKEEICYDNHMYLYHLGCHTWVSHEILGNPDKSHEYRYPKQQGVFGHAADVRNGNTLLIVGGYHGSVNADLLAFVLPPMLASRDGDSFEPEQICNRHRSVGECTANPECGWCSADEICYGRTVGINCTTNLQTTRCPGVCPALGDCHSCLIHGNSSVGVGHNEQVSSVANKLRLDHCTWCVQNARCHHKDDNFGVCGLREDTPSQVPGWWGPKGTEVVKVEECRVLDRRPGLTFLKYRHPANWSQPDSVTIINATTVDFNMPSLSTRTEQSLGGEIIARLLGFLRPPETWQETHETLRMCASYSSATLSLSRGESQSELEVVANLTTESSQCVAAILPSGEPAILMPGRYLVDFESHNTVNFGPYITQSKMELMHNKSQENAKVFTFEYLEPYENGSCHLYTNCLYCLTDSLCGWCDLNNRCLPRSENEEEVCRSSDNQDDWHYLTLLPSRCANCSNYITCESCVDSSLCEWWIEDARCARRGRFADAVVDLGQCPVPCHQRSNCSQCLDDRGRCVWCEATEECFSFSVYTSEYQFGLCREWVDQVYYSSGFPSASPHQQRVGSVSKPALLPRNDQCKSCSRHVNCSSCLRTLSCGWCYSAENPIMGVCVEGDFNHAGIDSCSAAINVAHNSELGDSEVSWAYAECPDVDECNLELDNCHEFAECTNTRGSFSCQCKRGYSGDGIHTCAKTCYHDCVHGWCVGAPVYSCKCELGWTGDDCSINCGCNNHSTCTKGVGKCDECHDWTMGEHCEECRPGSYGNATTSQGCQSCNCNDHGNVEEGICDSQTGECFCQDNTEGDTCDKCKKGYYGDPRHGGMCYYQCVSRGMLSGIEPQGLGSRLGLMTPWEMRQGGPPTRECLWIVRPYDAQNKSLAQESSVIQFTIHDDINISCEENGVYVYDGLPDFVSTNPGHQSHVLGIFCSMDTQYPATVEAKTGVLTVYYKQGDKSEGFNSSYVVLTCPEKCTGNHICRNDQCVCKEGWTGANCSSYMCHNNCSADKKQGVCDKAYGRCLCSPGFGGDDCSVLLQESQLVFTQLFDSTKLADSQEHLRKTLPRFGHSLVADRRGSLWMFGGFSLSHGPLNDIRLFDTKNNTWMPVTIDSTRDTSMPQGRYFHAAEISHSRQEIYVYGGLTEKDNFVGLRNNTLNDFWKFSLKNQRWIEIPNKRELPPLAGHTLTLRREGELETLLLLGGFSPKYGFLDTVWEYNLDTGQWEILSTTGKGPAGVYGHSTVYHQPTQTFYLYGGYMYSINHTFISDKLYALHYPTKFWSVLPRFLENHAPEKLLPRARFLHSAVTTDEYMLVFGGRTYPQNTTDSLHAYSYTCNQWIRLVSKDVEIVGTPPPPTYSQAMTLDLETGAAYIIGGFDGGIQNHVTRITLPHDLCYLWKSREKCSSLLGCSFCSVHRDDGTNSTYCYSVHKEPIESCNKHEGGILVSDNGAMCNATWLGQRYCGQFKSCSECLAKWPGFTEEKEVCKWCPNCPVGRCVHAVAGCDRPNKCGSNQRGLSNVSECSESFCSATDCEKCSEMSSCVWTRHVSRLPDLGVKVAADPMFDWNCVVGDIIDQSGLRKKIPQVCPARCSDYNDCKSCLQAPGAEGGWHECRWSIKLNECISPSYQPMYCAGGVCGLVLRHDNIGFCPERCSSFKQCSTCLSHTHCGWCSVQVGNSTGYGICTEGSLDSPNDGPAHSSCSNLYYQQEAAALTDGDSSSSNPLPTLAWDSPSRQEPTFAWHYVRCPPENECLNNHHTCDNKSEQCVDLEEGFQCVCGPGYKSDRSMCVPVCSQGCVRGVCVEPDKCQCDFGYVGANCSIQCQCNGHANCAGPDKLDECLGCHNNTQGKQCDRCKPLFVGDPTNGGTCVPCIDYCNGHTPYCINDTMVPFPPFPTSATEPSRAELESFLMEGPTTRARCIHCHNLTMGDKCDDCIPGNFRINQDKRTSCRPCECHGHGDRCDSATGENCDCHNNTESDPTCSSNNKGSSPCWMHQCSKCKESYMGTPTNGHQCYRQMTVDSKFCFDAKQLEECQMKPNPLESGHSVFFVVQPRFMNVDIRVIVDVTQGALDLFLSPLEDTFVVTVNASNGDRRVEVDSKYQKRTEENLSSGDVIVHRNIMELVSSETEVTALNGSSGTPDHSYWSMPQSQIYVMLERGAHGLTTFVTVPKRNTFLIVRNLQNRLVLTLPQDRHELGSTKFYMALTATESSYGMIFFRQDQLHIDLFVFFSVFFSCFFLFLAACVVAWKAKQAADVRRARRRHVVEMLHMAKRPFATVTLLLDSPNEPEDQLMLIPTSSTQSPHRKKQRKQHIQSGCDIRPVAVEPTDDGVAAVGTVFVQLPGGSEAPVRLALASSLILLTRVYPLNGRAFLRRRSSHAPS